MNIEKVEIDTREIITFLIIIGVVLVSLIFGLAWTIGKIKSTETLRLETIQALGLKQPKGKGR